MTTKPEISGDHDQQIVDEIEAHMKNPPKGSVEMELTPGACLLLYDRLNTDNRPFKAGKIARFAHDMGRGKWGLTGDTIKFSDKMRLRDGQNRLLACVRAGVPFTTHVVFGIKDDLFSVMDRGKNRTPADALAIMGIPNSGPISSAVRWAELITEEKVQGRTTFEPDDVRDLFLKKHSGVTSFLPQARIIHESATMNLSPGMITAFLYVFDQIDPDMADQFGHLWANGKPKGRGAAVRKMRGELIKMAGTIGRVHDVVQAAYIIIGWNLFMAGRAGRPTDFYWDRKQDEFPTISRTRRTPTNLNG